MIEVYRLDELFLDQKPSSHFGYVVMEEIGGKMRLYIECYTASAAKDDVTDEIITVRSSDVEQVVTIANKPGQFGFFAKVGEVLVVFFVIFVSDSAHQEKIINEFRSKMKTLRDWQLMHQMMSKESKLFRKPKPDVLYWINMETFIMAKLYVLILTCRVPKGIVKGDFTEKCYFLSEKLLAMFFYIIQWEFKEDADEIRTEILANISESRACFNCVQFTHKKCGKCFAPYCSRKCQVEDWPKHKKQCKDKDASLKKYANRKHPIRVQAYFDRLNKSPVIGFGKFRNIVIDQVLESVAETMLTGCAPEIVQNFHKLPIPTKPTCDKFYLN